MLTTQIRESPHFCVIGEHNIQIRGLLALFRKEEIEAMRGEDMGWPSQECGGFWDKAYSQSTRNIHNATQSM
jgi:hypothetical protein